MSSMSRAFGPLLLACWRFKNRRSLMPAGVILKVKMPRARAKVKRNPVLPRSEEPLPHMDPDYPIKAWVLPDIQEEVQTVSIEQDNGTYVAVILSDRSIRHTARTRKEAEEGVLQLYRERRRANHRFAEDEDNHRSIVEVEHEKTMALKEFLKRAR